MPHKETIRISKQDFLNVKEAAEFLDYSKSYLYKLTQLKIIPHYKPNGKKLYFKRSDLGNWITRNKITIR
jgi:excisionase family DNA binding protein